MTHEDNLSMTSQERAEALSTRIARLTELVSARSDETSRQLRGHLDLLAATLEETARSIPPTSPPGDGEMVLTMPPALDVIEALVTGQPVGEGGTHPSATRTSSKLGLGQVAKEADRLAVASEELFAGDDSADAPASPDDSSAEPAGPVLAASAEAAELPPASEDDADAPGDALASTASEEGALASGSDALASTASEEGALASESDALAASPEDEAPASESDALAASPEDEAPASESDALAASPEDEAPASESDALAAAAPEADALASESDALASEYDAAAAAKDEALAESDASLEDPELLDAAHPGMGGDAATEIMPAVSRPPPVPEDSESHEPAEEASSASGRSSDAWAPVSVSGEALGGSVDLTQEREVPQGVLRALSLDEEGDSDESMDLLCDQPSPGLDSFDEPHADATREEPIPLETTDVVTSTDVDLLDAARGEARHMLASLGASDDETFEEIEPLEPLERLARIPPSSARPHARAVAVVPRQVAYRALAAPMRLDDDGTLACLVPEDYEPERLDELATTLERRVVAVKAPHDEVIEALEAAYGPVGGVDQDALLMAISDESSSSRTGLMGRMSRWLRNT